MAEPQTYSIHLSQALVRYGWFAVEASSPEHALELFWHVYNSANWTVQDIDWCGQDLERPQLLAVGLHTELRTDE